MICICRLIWLEKHDFNVSQGLLTVLMNDIANIAERLIQFKRSLPHGMKKNVFLH
jgi:hypothetical protein